MHRIDEKVTDEAVQAIHTNGPDLSWVYLEYTDDMGHDHGDSPEFYKAIDYADKQVGRIWDAIEHRQQNFNEDWLIISNNRSWPRFSNRRWSWRTISKGKSRLDSY